jgi:hypothetical protein
VAFLLVFAGLIVIVQALLAASNSNDGLGSSHASLHYLWTFAPTAFVVLLLAFWTRVECQTKLIAPWHTMLRGPAAAHRSLLVDYISTFPLLSIYKALRNGDYTVAAAATNSVILRIIIVISTALITLSSTSVFYPEIRLILQSEFVDSTDGLTTNNALTSYALEGLIRLNTSIPDGITSQYAYQLVRSDLAATSMFNATVDGLSVGLNCSEAQIDLTGVGEPVHGTYENHINVTLTSSGCELDLSLVGPFVSTYGVHQYFTRLASGGCGGSEDVNDQRLGVVSAVMNYTRGAFIENTAYDGDVYDVLGDLLQSMALICTPTYSIRPVEITRNDTETQLSIPSDSLQRQLDHVHAWDIMQAHFDSYQNSLQDFSWNYLVNISSAIQVDVDPYFRLAMQLANATVGLPTVDALFDGQGLQQFALAYYQQYSAVLAHGSLMAQSETPATGSAWVVEDRLLVRALAAHLMTGLLAVAIVLLGVVWITRPAHTILPQNPATPIGTAGLLAQSLPLLASLRGMGGVSMASLRGLVECWDYQVETDHKDQFVVQQYQRLPTNDDLESHYFERHQAHPRTLHPVNRGLVSVLLVGVIVALEVTLRISDRDDGLGDVGDETYVHYLWTTVPAVVLTLFGMYFAAVDFDTRALAPYSQLSRGAPFESSVGLDLVNKFTIQTIIKEIQTGSLAAFAATVAVVLTSLLTIFSSSLFYATSVTTTSPAILETSSLIYNGSLFTGTDGDQSPGALMASLILASNLSYPAFTYQDLAFLELGLLNESDSAISSSLNSSGLVINATVPAVRSKFTCRLYQPSQIQTNFTLGYNVSLVSNPLRLDIDQEDCKKSNITEWLESNVALSTGPNTLKESYFGAGDHADYGGPISGCSDFLWMWGHWTLAADGKSVSSITASALGCNETIESVGVATQFFGPELRIDPAFPPVPDDASAQALDTDLNNIETNLYYQLAPVSSPTNNFDNYFTLLTTSRYAVPPEMLGDPAQASAVADAIRLQHGIIRAQVVSTTYRGEVNPDTMPFERGVVGNENATLTHAATVSDDFTRRRVVQDPLSTRMLEALLGAALLLSGLSWLLMRKTDVLPRRPTSIASVAALLVDGNLFEYLPRGAAWAGMGDLARRFGDNAEFRLGWRALPDGSGERYMIYVVQNGADGGGVEHENTPMEGGEMQSFVKVYPDVDVQESTEPDHAWQNYSHESGGGYTYMNVPEQGPTAHRSESSAKSSGRPSTRGLEEVPISPISSLEPHSF